MCKFHFYVLEYCLVKLSSKFPRPVIKTKQISVVLAYAILPVQQLFMWWFNICLLENSKI